MTKLVTYEFDDGVATITMDDGKANALGNQMFDELGPAFDQAEKDKAVVILTGRERRFSGGFDLNEMRKGPQEAMALTSRGSKLARRVLSFERPVIGSSNGHCIAMGAFMMLACDYRIGAEGDFKIGLNETMIGMTMHNFGIELGRYRLPLHYFNRCVINAEIYDPKGAIRAGFYDRTVPVEQLDMAAKMAGGMFKQLNAGAFRGTKLRSRKAIFAILDQAIEDDLDPAKIHAV